MSRIRTRVRPSDHSAFRPPPPRKITPAVFPRVCARRSEITMGVVERIVDHKRSDVFLLSLFFSHH